MQDHAGTADWLVYRRISLYWGARYIDDVISRTIEHVDRSDTDSAEWTVDEHRRYHHITDTLFSTVAILQDMGTSFPVVERVTYDAYGRPELWLPNGVYHSHHSSLPRQELSSPGGSRVRLRVGEIADGVVRIRGWIQKGIGLVSVGKG